MHILTHLYLHHVVLCEDPPGVPIVPVLPDGGLHLLLHRDELTVLPTQVQEEGALGRPAAVVTVAAATHQPVCVMRKRC